MYEVVKTVTSKETDRVRRIYFYFTPKETACLLDPKEGLQMVEHILPDLGFDEEQRLFWDLKEGVFYAFIEAPIKDFDTVTVTIAKKVRMRKVLENHKVATTWKCCACDFSTKWTFRDVENRGIPVCPEHGIDLQLVKDSAEIIP